MPGLQPGAASTLPHVKILPVHDDTHDTIVTLPCHTRSREVRIFSEQVQYKKKGTFYYDIDRRGAGRD